MHLPVFMRVYYCANLCRRRAMQEVKRSLLDTSKKQREEHRLHKGQQWDGEVQYVCACVWTYEISYTNSVHHGLHRAASSSLRKLQLNKQLNASLWKLFVCRIVSRSAVAVATTTQMHSMVLFACAMTYSSFLLCSGCLVLSHSHVCWI